jgi:purine-binding chemotaxis protein CheW
VKQVAREQRKGVHDRDKNLVGFRVGDMHCAIDIRRVKEIIRPLPVVAIPYPPPAVVGVADHRGEVVLVLDVRRRFGLPEAPPSRRTKWIIVSMSDKSVGLIVDAVTEVFAASQETQRAVPSIGMGDAARAVTAVYGHRGTLVFVLDVDRIGVAAELVDLGAVLSPRRE